MTRRDSLLAALVALVWGLNFLAVDVGLRDVPPLLFLAIRFVAVVGVAIWFVPRPAVSWRLLLTIGGLMSLGQFGFLYLAMAEGFPAGLASLVLQAQVVFTIVIAVVALRERPTQAQIAGVALGMAGLVAVGLGRGGDVRLGVLGLMLLAALCWASGNVVVRAARVPGGLGVTVWSALAVPIPAFLLSLVVDGPHGVWAGLGAFGWSAALSTAYTVVFASYVGYGLFNSLLARNPASAVVPWILLVPVVGIVSAWIVLGERPAPAELGGGVLLLGGALIANGVLRLRQPGGGAGRGAQPSGRPDSA
ncbi:MAG: EamA family transporter [Nocardioides sp.]|uniref:EamA family transporter n=1 Tax=Nocardioides sp. TaxID=35761 RepID=UPI0039E586AD